MGNVWIRPWANFAQYMDRTFVTDENVVKNVILVREKIFCMDFYEYVNPFYRASNSLVHWKISGERTQSTLAPIKSI